MENRIRPPRLLIAATLMVLTGCSEDQRLADMAKDSTRRQAEQNQEMIRLNQEVAKSHQRVLEADSQSRQEVLKLQRELVERDQHARQDLHALEREIQAAASQERTSLDRQHEALEQERRGIAGERKRDPILAAAITGLGIVLACLAPIVLAICLLWVAHRQEPSEAELAELLVQEIASDHTLLFGPGEAHPTVLPPSDEPPRLPPAAEADREPSRPSST
jgi:hypothetical protein